MNNDPKRYDNDDLYEEDIGYEDGYDADDYDYIVDDEDEDENALWDDDEDPAETDEDSDEPPIKKRRKRKETTVFADMDADEAETEEYDKTQRRLAREQRLIDEIEADAQEHPVEDDDEDEAPERKKLKRELRAEALARLEDAARTERDFKNVIAWWDRLDANRQRKERYHELYRSGDDIPLDYGAVADGLYFPDTLNDVLAKQERKGEFIDSIFYCPYDIHELVTDEDMSNILRDLNEDHKFLLFLWALRQYSSTRIAAIKGQSDRNIRKVRNTMLKKIRKKLLAALIDKAEKQLPMTILEKEFLTDNSKPIETAKKK